MCRNVGSVDRFIRVLVGVGLISWGIATSNWWGALGVVPLATGLLGFCPAYLPFGLRTREANQEPAN